MQGENFILNNKERQALTKVEHSLNIHDRHSEVGVPWKVISGGLALNVNMSLSAYHNTPNIFILKALLMLCPLVNYIIERYSINFHT
jgi:hypothetical protein